MGTPKALLRDVGGVPFIDRAIGVLFDGGCSWVTVVLGAAAGDARAILDDAGWTACDDVDVIVADEWSEGIGASLRTGLRHLSDADAAMVMLVDLPDVHEDVVARVAALASPDALARATYDGKPGHPVLIGRDHWAGVAEVATGDAGARPYLDAHGVVAVACDDLATGRDMDTPSDLPGGR